MAIGTQTVTPAQRESYRKNSMEMGEVIDANPDTHELADEAKFFYAKNKQELNNFNRAKTLLSLDFYKLSDPSLREGIEDGRPEARDAFMKETASPEQNVTGENSVGMSARGSISFPRVEKDVGYKPDSNMEKSGQGNMSKDTGGGDLVKEFVSGIKFGQFFKFLFSQGREFLGAMAKLSKEQGGLNKQPKQPEMTEEQMVAQKKEAKKNSTIKASYDAAQNALVQVKNAAQERIGKLMQRLGLGGMGADQLNSSLGKNRNLSNQNIETEANLHAAATSVSEAAKIQEKRKEQLKSQSVEKPVVNMNNMEGGTAGGTQNISVQNAGG